jgi:hypothetical protein
VSSRQRDANRIGANPSEELGGLLGAGFKVWGIAVEGSDPRYRV